MQGLDKYKVSIDIPVRWGDMDSLNHVNNTIYARWIEDARIAYLYKCMKTLKTGQLGPILARQDIKFIAPVAYPDTVKIGVRVEQILDDRIILETKMWSHNSEKVVSLSHSTVMAYDLVKKQKAYVPEQWIKNINALES